MRINNNSSKANPNLYINKNTTNQNIKKNNDPSFSNYVNSSGKTLNTDKSSFSCTGSSSNPVSIIKSISDKIINEVNDDHVAPNVERLKQQINSNQYQINALEIAKKMIMGD